MLIWKLYIEAMQMEEEFKDSEADETVDFSQVLPDQIFSSFTDKATVIQAVDAAQNEPSSEEIKSGRPIEITKDQDSDDEEEEDDGDF